MSILCLKKLTHRWKKGKDTRKIHHIVHNYLFAYKTAYKTAYKINFFQIWLYWSNQKVRSSNDCRSKLGSKRHFESNLCLAGNNRVKQKNSKFERFGNSDPQFDPTFSIQAEHINISAFSVRASLNWHRSKWTSDLSVGNLTRWVLVVNLHLLRVLGKVLPRRALRKEAKVAREEQRWLREREQENKAMDDSSTEFWSKFIPMLVYPAVRWASWTPSSMTSLKGLQAKHRDLLTTTKGKPSHRVKFKRQCDFSFLAN